MQRAGSGPLAGLAFPSAAEADGACGIHDRSTDLAGFT
jgi:hypothetical protein